MSVLKSYTFADGQIPSDFEVTRGESNISVVAAPGGGSPGGGANALRFTHQLEDWTYDDTWNYWYAYGMEDSPYLEFVIPAKCWTSITYWTYHVPPSVSYSPLAAGEWIGVYSTSRQRRRRFLPSTNTNTHSQTSSWYEDEWAPAANYGPSGWTKHTLNLSPNEHEVRFYLELYAWSETNISPLSSSVQNFVGEVYYADIEIQSVPVKIRDADLRLGTQAELGDLWFPFVWVNEWSDWITDTVIDPNMREPPRYASHAFKMAEELTPTPELSYIEYDAGLQSSLWDTVRAGGGTYVFGSSGESYWIKSKPNVGFFNTPWYTTKQIFFFSGLGTSPNGIHRARVSQGVQAYDFMTVKQYYSPTHQELLGSIGVTFGTGAGSPTHASPIPTAQRDVIDTEIGPYMSGITRAYIQYGEHYTTLNTLLDYWVKLNHDTSGDNPSWAAGVQLQISILNSAYLDYKPVLENSGLQYNDQHIHPWSNANPAADLTVSRSSPVPAQDKWLEPGMGRLVDGELWIFSRFNTQYQGLGAAFSGEESVSRYDAAANTNIMTTVQVRPWRYWMSYETDLVTPCGVDKILPLRLIHRDDNVPPGGSSGDAPRVLGGRSTYQHPKSARGGGHGPNAYW